MQSALAAGDNDAGVRLHVSVNHQFVPRVEENWLDAFGIKAGRGGPVLDQLRRELLIATMDRAVGGDWWEALPTPDGEILLVTRSPGRDAAESRLPEPPAQDVQASLPAMAVPDASLPPVPAAPVGRRASPPPAAPPAPRRGSRRGQGRGHQIRRALRDGPEVTRPGRANGDTGHAHFPHFPASAPVRLPHRGDRKGLRLPVCPDPGDLEAGLVRPLSFASWNSELFEQLLTHVVGPCRGVLDAVLLTGDMASDGKPRDMIHAARQINKLVTTLAVPAGNVAAAIDRVFLVPGNHDRYLGRWRRAGEQSSTGTSAATGPGRPPATTGASSSGA